MKEWREAQRKIERSKLTIDPVIQLFAKLMKEATMQDWLSVFDFNNSQRHISHYNHTTRCVDQPCHSAAPWPVLWILARFIIIATFGAKKRYRMLTSLKLGSTCLQKKISGDGFFRDTARRQFSINVPSHGRTRACTHRVAPALDTWLSKLKRSLAEVFVKCSKAAAPDRSFWNNNYPC